MVNLFHLTGQARATGEIQYSSILSLYAMISTLEFIMLLLIMPALTASAVSGEKEKQTFDLMMTTALRPGAFISGKLGSAQTEMMVLLLSALPVQSLVFIFGGVTGADLILVFLTYAVAMTLVGAVGIFCSAICRRSIAANVVSYTVTAMLTLGTAALCRFSGYVNPEAAQAGAGPGFYVLLTNPAVTFASVMNLQAGEGSSLEYLTKLYGNIPVNGITAHWIGLSLAVQFLAAVLLVRGAVRFLVPGREKFKR
jgi:ABC-2 type transport system permease protein